MAIKREAGLGVKRREIGCAQGAWMERGARSEEGDSALPSFRSRRIPFPPLCSACQAGHQRGMRLFTVIYCLTNTSVDLLTDNFT